MPTPTQRYLLLPPRGLTTTAATANMHVATFLRSMAIPKGIGPASAPDGIRLIDSAHENGLKLVEMTTDAMLALKAQAPGIRVVPEVFYQTARAPLPYLQFRKKTLSGAKPANARLRFEIGEAGVPVANATVVAFTDFAGRVGADGRTAADGTVSLAVGATVTIERLYVYPEHGCWPIILRNLQLPRPGAIRLRPIDLAAADVLQHFRAGAPGASGEGVTVGVVDTGCGPHPDLPVSGGLNTVIGESPADYADNGDQHGTHVAGIVAARGVSPSGMSGLAPSVSLRAYRVFAQGQGASNYSIAKAIDAAVADGCDIINMSLGGRGPSDPATSSAIADARAAGVVVICASGNDGMNQVSQPGADPRAVAVGCFGRKGLFPADSISASNVGKPLGKPDKRNFMASFSNHAAEIDLAGPGVGVVSTVPYGRWAVMDGTSMACPAVAGMVARLLSANAAVRDMPRDQLRSDEILRMTYGAAVSLGFGPQYEGNGWVR